MNTSNTHFPNSTAGLDARQVDPQAASAAEVPPFNVGELMAAITEAHIEAVKSAVSAVARARQAGLLILRAKKGLAHGKFTEFVKRLPFSPRTARAYMRLARLRDEEWQRVADLPLRVALRVATKARDVKPAGSPSGDGAMRVMDIPLGSVGSVLWRIRDDTAAWLEVHPVVWPDGTTVGLHWAYAEIRLNGSDDEVTSSIRPIARSEFCWAVAPAYPGAPWEEMKIVAWPPSLWEPAPQPAWKAKAVGLTS